MQKKISKSAFVAFPSQPQELYDTIVQSANDVESWGNRKKLKIVTWPQMDSLGVALADEVRSNIENADYLVCDITFPNQNVYYEIGYAIGLGKMVSPVLNRSFAGAENRITADGIFDGIGYKSYENREELQAILKTVPTTSLVELYERDQNFNQPMFALDCLKKTDFRNAIFSTIKESKVFFRSFDPIETSRFSTTQIISEVTSSSGIVIPLLGRDIVGSEKHNLRAAFLAGLSHGLRKPTLLLQRDTGPVPLDYRDKVELALNERSISEVVKEFSRETLVATQSSKEVTRKPERSILQELTLGQSAAENEFRTLASYFVETSEYLKTLRGEARVVAGRKGSGKTAIFFQVRDSHRKNKNLLNIDLKPESHQLSLFREELQKFSDVGLFDHTLAAFWDFVLLSEVLLGFQKYFEYKAKTNSDALLYIREIQDLLGDYEVLQSGDFTARLTNLSGLILQEIAATKAKGKAVTPETLTNIIYSRGISEFTKLTKKLCAQVEGIVFLFDNIDKGWITKGVDDFDIRMVRLLVEALDKIKHRLADRNMDFSFSFSVFLRNDIYELLVDQTPDRGKSGLLKIDWTDRTKLKRLIFLRLLASSPAKEENFEDLWFRYFVKTVNGQDTFEYFVDHCLMRPRFLINIVEYSISNAINRGHQKVMSVDCVDAVVQHSRSLLNEIGYEIEDASGIGGGVLNYLELLPENFCKSDALGILSESGLEKGEAIQFFDLLMWYGVVGIEEKNGNHSFVYDYDYDVKRLRFKSERSNNGNCFVLNPAFTVDFEFD